MALGKFFNYRKQRSGGKEPSDTPTGSSAASGSEQSRAVAGQQPGSDERSAILREYEDLGVAWFWACDAKGRLIYLSDEAAASIGRSRDDLIGRPLTALMDTDPENPDASSNRPLNFRIKAQYQINDLTVKVVGARHPHRSAEAQETATYGSTGSRAEPAADIWWSVYGKPIFDAEGAFAGYRGSAKDVSTAFHRQLQESRLAEHDSLTGLSNRHRIEQRLDSMLKAFASAKRNCALMMLDLDRFKQVNDTLGHQAGDEILRQVADRLRSVVGSAEIGRLGGDEFQIIMADIDDRGKLGELAARIVQILSQPYSLGEKRATIGASIGIAIAPYDGLERAELTHAADLALYAAKHGGRGAFRFYCVELKGEALKREALENELNAALENGELSLEYQPVVRTTDNIVVGCEALMRWTHPERGNIGPSVFIPIAEESDLILRLGEWALRQACDDAANWPKTMRVAVNIAPFQFYSPGFAELVANVLAASGLEASRLELELTEDLFMGDADVIERAFEALKKLGVRFALDNFGKGYSSISYLRSAPFDKLKVDRSFLERCSGADADNTKMIAAIVGLSVALDMETTVEGVETADQLELVRAKGAKLVQGWIYSGTMTQGALLARLESGEMALDPGGEDSAQAERRAVLRGVGVIHQDHYYRALMRDFRAGGARLEGLIGVSVGEGLVLDLGEGQLCVCTVTEVADATFEIEFETALVSNGAGGLCTRHRVSPYMLATAGMPLTALPQGSYPMEAAHGAPTSRPRLMEV